MRGVVNFGREEERCGVGTTCSARRAALHDGVECSLEDAGELQSEEGRLEEDLWAAEPLRANGDELRIAERNVSHCEHSCYHTQGERHSYGTVS